ncbi:pilus assembly protein TadG-related protein [Aureimonas populi]|uniref:Pilus assembly protein TadG-related protein n=1 Tax=Aureimonas populi TaxID=1701758 RepID=A0ABW5CPR6_9HYPH|nr:pilus assembly protein TadG-related protein [Aureimonas populi]
MNGARFRKAASGSVATMTALLMPLLLGAGALGVDVGAFYLERRSLQAASDAAALAAVSDPARAESLARETLARNGYADATFRIMRGRYIADESVHRDRRFVVDGDGHDIRLEASSGTTLYLGRILTDTPPTVSVRSDARRPTTVSISTGSRLAQLDGGVVNDVLGVLGAGLSLTAADYKGLADVGLELGPLLGEVTRLLPVSNVVGTVNDILETEITLNVLLGAMANNLSAEGRHAQASSLRRAAMTGASAQARVKLGDMLALDESLKSIRVGYPSSALAAEVSVLSLLDAVLTQRDVGNALSLGLKVPGLVKQDLRVMIGESMRQSRSLAVGGVGAQVDTAQVRLHFNLKTGELTTLLGLEVGLPIEAVVAGGTARVVEASCSSDPLRHRVVVEALPGLAKVEIGELGRLEEASVNKVLPFARIGQLKLLGLISLVRVDAHAAVRALAPKPERLTFTGAEIGGGVIKTAGTTQLVGSVLDGLIDTLELETRPWVLGLVGDLVVGIVRLLRPLATPVDMLLDAVLGLLGVGIGELDVRVDGIACSTGQLVG